MKHTLLLALLALLTPFISCSHDNTQDNEITTGGTGQHNDEAESRPFTFTIQGDFDNPAFLKSSLSADGVELTDMWVIDYKDGEIKQQLHQTPSDTDWGSPTMSLTLGTHHILFLASRGTNPTYTNGTVSWTKAHDTFYKDYEVTVVKTSNGNRAVTLDRVGTKLMVTVEDAIPVGTTSLAFVPGTWYNGWNMISGQPVAASKGYNVTFSLPQSHGGQKGTAYAIWSMSGTDEWASNISITSKAGETINAEVTIIDAPFVANRTTKYTGCLYSNAENSLVSLNTSWLPSYENVY